jgi:hypothetical protein
VAVIRYQHETCTFCPGGDTEVQDWTRIRPPLEGDEVLEADAYIKGFVQQARDYGDIELLGINSPYEVFGTRPALGSARTGRLREHFFWNTELEAQRVISLKTREKK